MEDMAFIPYASVVLSLMHSIVCTKLKIAKVVGVLVELWLILDMNIGLQ